MMVDELVVKQWWSWMWSLGPEWLVAGVATLILHEVVYFGMYIPYFLADFVPFLQKYKIQKTVSNDWALQWHCLKRVLFSHFVIEGPLVFLTHPIVSYRGMYMDAEHLPTMTSLALKMVLFFLFEDFWFYWVHRLLHHRAIYKYIHKVHHDHAAPFGIAGEYAHPAETFILGLGTILPPWIMADHLATLWLWTALRTMQVVDCHSGYNFPWSLNNFLPGWGGAEFHDYHHMTFTGNFASTFIWWDAVFGTDSSYRVWRNKQNIANSQEPDLIDKTSSFIHWVARNSDLKLYQGPSSAKKTS